MVFNEKYFAAVIAVGLPFLSLATQVYAQNNSDAVTLNYNWPVGLSGKIEIVENITNIDSAGKKAVGHMGTGQITTESHTDGLLVNVSDVDYVIDNTVSETGIDPNLEKILRVVMTENSWLVAPDGSFIDVVGADDMAARIKEVLDTLFADHKADLSDSFIGSLIGTVETLMSKEKLVETYASQWNGTVKDLDGMRLQIGQPQEIDITTIANEFIGKSLNSIGTYELLGRLPCHDSESENRCVEIKFTTKLTEESKKTFDDSMSAMLKVMHKEMHEELGEGNSQIAEEFVATFDFKNALTLITEPSTLIPHRLITTMYQSIDMGTDLGKRETNTEIITRYEYH